MECVKCSVHEVFFFLSTGYDKSKFWIGSHQKTVDSYHHWQLCTILNHIKWVHYEDKQFECCNADRMNTHADPLEVEWHNAEEKTVSSAKWEKCMLSLETYSFGCDRQRTNFFAIAPNIEVSQGYFFLALIFFRWGCVNRRDSTYACTCDPHGLCKWWMNMCVLNLHVPPSVRDVKPWALCVKLLAHVQEPSGGHNYLEFHPVSSLTVTLSWWR